MLKVDNITFSHPVRCKLRLHCARLYAVNVVDLRSKFKSCFATSFSRCTPRRSLLVAMLGVARTRCAQTSCHLFPSIARLLTVPPNAALPPLAGNYLLCGIFELPPQRCCGLTALLWGAKAPVVANNANFALLSQATLPRVAPLNQEGQSFPRHRRGGVFPPANRRQEQLSLFAKEGRAQRREFEITPRLLFSFGGNLKGQKGQKEFKKGRPWSAPTRFVVLHFCAEFAAAHLAAGLCTTGVLGCEDVLAIVDGLEACVLLAAEGYLNEAVNEGCEVDAAVLPKVE